MSWFDSSIQNSDLLQPVTFSRLVNAGKKIDWDMEVDQEALLITTGFSGYLTHISCFQFNSQLHVASYSTGRFLPANQINELLSFCNTINQETLFTKISVELDADSELLLEASSIFPVSTGVTDEQLNHLLEAGIKGNVAFLETYSQYFETIDTCSLPTPNSNPLENHE